MLIYLLSLVFSLKERKLKIKNENVDSSSSLRSLNRGVVTNFQLEGRDNKFLDLFHM